MISDLCIASLVRMFMMFYYLTLGLVGPVFGVVLQSTRGLLSVMLGILVSRFRGHWELEIPLTRRAFLARLASALLMFTAIALYATG